jgi:hypothetical protein
MAASARIVPSMNRKSTAAIVLSVIVAATAPAQESRPPWKAEVRLLDDGGQPLAGVAVRARLPFAVAYSELDRRTFQAKSDASGIAAFTDLLPEQPIVFEVTADPWVPTRSPVCLPRAPDDGSILPTPQMVLTGGRVAQVSVQDAFGVPLEDAEVRTLPLVEPRLERAGRTDSAPDRGSVRAARVDGVGKARFEKLPAELLTVEIRSGGFETRMATVDLRRAPSAEIVVRLDRDPSPPAASMPWLPSVRDAFATAESGALPILVAMTMDGERANDALAAHHFKDPEVIRVAEFLPCLVASVFGEGGVHANEVDHGEVEGVCTRYGSIPCEAHRAVEAWARNELVSDPEFTVPRHFLVAPDGRILAERGYYLSERALRWMILRALRDVNSDAAVWTCLRRLQPLWRTLCAGAESDERREAVATLARLVESGDGYAAMLLRGVALDALPGDVRLQILDALLVPALDDPARALQGFLHDTEPAIRMRAWQRLATVPARVDAVTAAGALAFEEDDSALAAALPALRVEERGEALAVADAEVGERWRIVEILLGRADAASVKGVDAILDQVGTEGRNRILRVLARNPEDETGIRRLFTLATAPDVGAIAAMRALAGVSGDFDARVKDVLTSQLKSPNALVRQEAATSLGRRGATSAASPLEAALLDADQPVRLAAAIALWRLGNRAGGSVLVDSVDDPESGAEARSLLEAAWSEAAPADAAGWRKWLEGR